MLCSHEELLSATKDSPTEDHNDLYASALGAWTWQGICMLVPTLRYHSSGPWLIYD
jgi:hypothetical protein